uniref:Uncharacterized protein n=1 Tax=Nicotiana tabacum TaxID=4097 RepID=A0A1S4CCB1_TOBAC|nr:PREDICTED: uncharacterized protein LOC107817458 [Nicotiana tabacum]
MAQQSIMSNSPPYNKLKRSITHDRYDDLEDNIIFDKSDADGLSGPHYDAFVITLRITDTDVKGIMTFGEIVLPVLAGGVTLEMTFHVMNQETTYNAIIGCPWIHAMRAVPSNLYQVIKFPTPWGIFSIRWEQRTTQECYRIAQDCAHTQQLKGASTEA